ncbi:MAG: isoprenylcysteine carboxylmethyltransferase family protein [bacterium]
MADEVLKHRKGEHPAGDLGQIILWVVFTVIWVLDSFLLKLTTTPAAYIPLLIRLVVAAVILGLGFYLMAIAHFIVDEKKRPAGVVRSGAFKYVRHPLYLAALLFYLGVTVTTLSLACVGVFVVIFLFYNYIAGYEEKLLIAKFGDSYREYIKRTGRWLPKFT